MLGLLLLGFILYFIAGIGIILLISIYSKPYEK